MAPNTGTEWGLLTTSALRKPDRSAEPVWSWAGLTLTAQRGVHPVVVVAVAEVVQRRGAGAAREGLGDGLAEGRDGLGSGGREPEGDLQGGDGKNARQGFDHEALLSGGARSPRLKEE